MNPITRSAPPRASSMLEALRGLGYTTAAALADIIDNSISAMATEVRLQFVWKESNSYISIIDDGIGMNDSSLESAMKLGDRSPLDHREASDLGRFGLGLKTASFSQCRRLTVASKEANSPACCLRWDLDALASNVNGEWLLYEGTAEGSENLISGLQVKPHGTIVVWEVMDRIVTSLYTVDDFNDMIDRVESHLAMIFHRLLEGKNPRLSIHINDKRINAWDPFMLGHPAKAFNSPVELKETNSGLVELECHVLPHKDRLSIEEFEIGAGPEGWTAQQGFYVYRNKRLLVAGGWLGLGHGKAWTSDESMKLARIRLDIPNSADSDWKIDIKKSTARPPVSLRHWLTKYAEDTRTRARKVFAYRGAPILGLGKASIEHAWRTEHSANGVRYRIDLKNPVVLSVLEGAGDQVALIKAMLRVIEETVPIQRIWLDTAENKETPRTGFADSPSKEIETVLSALYSDFTNRRGMSSEAAKKMLLSTEPFQNFPNLVASLH